MEEKFSLNILRVLDKAHTFWEFRDPRKQNSLCPLEIIIQIFLKVYCDYFAVKYYGFFMSGKLLQHRGIVIKSRKESQWK